MGNELGTEQIFQGFEPSNAAILRVARKLVEAALAGASDVQLIGILGDSLLEVGVPVNVIDVDCDAVSPNRKQYSLRWSADYDSVDPTSRPNTLFEHMVEHQIGMLLAADSRDLFASMLGKGTTDAAAFATHLAPDVTVGFFDDVMTCFTTTEIGGFTSPQLSILTLTAPVFALALGARLNAGAARLLLQTYLGPNAADALLNGRVGLGEVAKIRAVVIYCDLVGFTPLTETLDPQTLIDELNLFFEIITQPISRAGGQVSGHVGDAAVMFFPVLGEENEGKLCAVAVDAVLDGLEALNRLNSSASRHDTPPLRARVGIDIGNVVHGNIGSAGRFSFTVIGTPVNRAARLQALAAKVQAAVLMTKDFAAAADLKCHAFGRHFLKGFDSQIEAVGYRDDTRHRKEVV